MLGMKGVKEMPQGSVRFRCSSCEWRSTSSIATCSCGNGVMEADHRPVRSITWDELMPAQAGIWRYSAALPPFPLRVSRAEGSTPLLSSRRLGSDLGLALSFKDETRNPTGSFKDRAAALIVSEAASRGCSGIVLTSSGNAAAALAMYSALVGIACRVYASPSASREKLLQAKAFGATIAQPSEMNERRLSEAASAAAGAPGWSDASTVAEKCPLTIEGYKTIAYEIAAVEAPVAVVIPVGAGTLLLGIWKGFRELRDWGLIRRMPILIGVQPDGWDSVTQAFKQGEEEIVPRFGGETIAHGVALGDPGVDGKVALRAVRESGGAMVSVDDAAVRWAQAQLARREGILAEPSGALSLAGAVQARDEKIIDAEDPVVVIVTGHGLKDTVALSELDAPAGGSQLSASVSAEGR